MFKRAEPQAAAAPVVLAKRKGQRKLKAGAVTRSIAGRVLQVVTGSTGLDDYEWGVTLFATAPDDLKEVVYTMRFDQASALYAEFGPFYVGMVAPVPDVLEQLGID